VKRITRTKTFTLKPYDVFHFIQDQRNDINADVTMCKYCIKGQYIKVTYLKNKNPMYFQNQFTISLHDRRDSAGEVK